MGTAFKRSPTKVKERHMGQKYAGTLLVIAMVCSLSSIRAQSLSAFEGDEQVELTATDSNRIELLSKLQKNFAISIWNNQLVYGVSENTRNGGYQLRFVDLETDEITHSIKNLPHSETSLVTQDGKLFVFGLTSATGVWESKLSEVKGKRIVPLTTQSGRRYLDDVFAHNGTFYGVNAGSRSVSSFKPGFFSWSWNEKMNTFSMPRKLAFLDDDVFVLEWRNIGFGDEGISFFDKRDFREGQKKNTDLNAGDGFGAIFDILAWNGSIIASGDSKLARWDRQAQTFESFSTSRVNKETPRQHYTLKSTEKCLVSIDPFEMQLSFFDRDLNEVDVWDLSTAGEQFSFPRNFAIDTQNKKVFVKSTRPCMLCKVSEGSVYSFSATGSEAEKNCF
jgi:hypothetical protein